MSLCDKWHWQDISSKWHKCLCHPTPPPHTHALEGKETKNRTLECKENGQILKISDHKNGQIFKISDRKNVNKAKIIAQK